VQVLYFKLLVGFQWGVFFEDLGIWLFDLIALTKFEEVVW
jgi:hypothetical protein